ncbi:gamma-glutamylcyclotransferase family protein [Halotia branconii]|uniref:Gamma-glutamylcyclotransferase n=1 Tax=Halotia branconii CENA392 TaxID=1539056 RepID=A0AAJ6NUS1_9CYAN|nr:gamma-glutamylcyclotransferase [Halotia branconii]WGV26793.1 gamma-glutamylcyclotransferase [Halotia branconii CENA392]
MNPKIKLSPQVRVFVYGTLKPSEANYQKYCAGKVLHAQRAVIKGQLFNLPFGYPALTSGECFVHGYLLSFNDLNILDALDELEDYQPTRQMSANLYNRQEVEICDRQGLPLGQAWVYFMTMERVYQLKGIPQPDGWWSSCGSIPPP